MDGILEALMAQWMGTQDYQPRSCVFETYSGHFHSHKSSRLVI